MEAKEALLPVVEGEEEEWEEEEEGRYEGKVALDGWLEVEEGG